MFTLPIRLPGSLVLPRVKEAPFLLVVRGYDLRPMLCPSGSSNSVKYVNFLTQAIQNTNSLQVLMEKKDQSLRVILYFQLRTLESLSVIFVCYSLSERWLHVCSPL